MFYSPGCFADMPHKSFNVKQIIHCSPYLLWLFYNCGKLSCSREIPLFNRFPPNHLFISLSGSLCPLIKSFVIMIISKPHFNCLLSPSKLVFFFKSPQMIEHEAQEICLIVLLALLCWVAMGKVSSHQFPTRCQWDYKLFATRPVWWLGCQSGATITT